MTGPSISFPPAHTIIDRYDKVTPASIYAVEGKIRKELHKQPCSAEGSDDHGWEWVLYKNDVWKMMDGVCTYDATTGAKTAGKEVKPPEAPGENKASNFVQLVAHQEKERNYANYQAAMTFAREGMDWSWETTNHFSDKKNKAGIIKDHPSDLLELLKTTYIKGSKKDDAIDAAEKKMNPEYNPDESIQTFWANFKIAKEELEELGKPPKDEDMIRNAMRAIRKHEDFKYHVTQWRSDTASKTPTWNEFKTHFTAARETIDDGPEDSGKTKMANQVANMSEEIEKTNQQNQTIASALTEALKTVTLLQQKVETLEGQKTTTTGPTDDSKPNPWKRTRYRESTNDLPNGERSKRRYPGSDTYCWSCGYDVAPRHHPCQHRKPGHREDATRDDIKGGSTRNLFHWTKDGN